MGNPTTLEAVQAGIEVALEAFGGNPDASLAAYFRMHKDLLVARACERLDGVALSDLTATERQELDELRSVVRSQRATIDRLREKKATPPHEMLDELPAFREARARERFADDAARGETDEERGYILGRLMTITFMLRHYLAEYGGLSTDVTPEQHLARLTMERTEALAKMKRMLAEFSIEQHWSDSLYLVDALQVLENGIREKLADEEPE